MAEDECVEVIAMGNPSGDHEQKYEIYKAGTDMFCVIGMDNNLQAIGKSTGSKPRYKQSYREAWESMRDFKGWLTSVPGNTSKAYCKLCQKELHCHRLSLLKHKVTYKHQRKEEEQKLMKLGGEAKESDSLISKDTLISKTTDILASGKSALFDIEGEESDVDDNMALPKATSSESCDALNQIDQKKEKCGNRCLSTHVLDVSKGVPAALVHVVLYKLIDGRWTLIHEGLTDADGRYNYFSSNYEKVSEGRYKLHYDVDKYFEKQNLETIFPFVEVAFDTKGDSSKYHIPLLLSPYGYSIYKGS